MNIETVSLPEIAVIGIEGTCTRANNIVSQLWEQANARFNEVAELAMKEKDGAMVGFWGAMSDAGMNFQPWTDGYTTGKYLAGVEVYKTAEAPCGWTKWVMPARKYLKAEVEPGKYGEVFTTIVNETIPAMGLKLSGAACDYTCPRDGKNYLFFPVA